MKEFQTSKTIVNILSQESPVPAYLFIKEKYQLGDKLLFVSSKSARSDIDFISRFLSLPAEMMSKVVFTEEEEFSYERICRRLRAELRPEEHYCVNLAGGSRYMALAVQQAFAALHSDFFYVNLRDNTIVQSIFDSSIDDDDDQVFPIRHRMKIGEYLSLHRMRNDAEALGPVNLLRSAAYTASLFDLYAKGRLDGRDHDVLEILRLHYRNRKSDRSVSVEDAERGRVEAAPSVPGLSRFLRYIRFVPERDGFLSKEEIGYLTGGWFEEYCCNKVKELVPVDDIRVGVHVAGTNTAHDNELDVVFIRDNRLRVIECKSGITNQRLFNEIVYKATALKEALLGLMCHSYIFTLKKDNEMRELQQIAASMGVDFCGYDVLTNNEKMTRRLMKR